MAPNDRGPGAQPGLIRMIVVNTERMRDRIEELPFDAHTAILAPNQAGKTSLMKLLPFFWGAEMRQICPPSEERRKFIPFYLPTDASYLACEYVNAHGEVRTVVAHSDPSKQNIQYRLIRGGISPSDLFCGEDATGKRVFIKNVDFESHARKRGYAVHPRLITSTKDYRGVIQGRYPSDSTMEKSQFAGLVNDFSIGRISAPLDNVDKLFLTTIDNNFALSDLLAIVTNKVVDFSSMRISLHGSSAQPEHTEIATDFRAYRKVMAAEPVLRDAVSADNRRRAFEAELLQLRSQLQGAAIRAARDVASIQAELDDLAARRSQEDAHYREASGEIVRRISTMEAESRSLIDLAARIEKARAGLLTKGADKAQERLLERPVLTARLETLDLKIGAIAGNRAEIEARFSTIIDQIREAARELIAGIDARLIAIPEEIERHRSDLEQRGADHEARIREGHAPALQVLTERLREEQARRNDISDLLGDVRAEPELAAEQDRLKRRVAEKGDEYRTIARKAEASMVAATSATEALTAASSAVMTQKQRLEALNRRLSDVQAQREPVQGSLRYWLERNQPDWRETIGKVIDERLLDRTDLAPVTEGGSGLFGVRLEIEHLPVACASLEALEQEQSRLFAEAGVLSEAVKIAEEAERQAGAARHKAVKTRDQHQAEAEIAKTNLSTAEAALKEADGRAEASRLARRQAIIADRAASDVRISELRTESDTLRQSHAAEMRAIAEDRARRIAEVIAPLRAESAALIVQKSEETRKRDAAVLAARADLDAALGAEGADPELMQRLTRERAEVKERLAALIGLDDLKLQWDRHLSEDVPAAAAANDRMGVLVGDLSIARFSENALKADHEKAILAREARKAELERRQKSLDSLATRANIRLKDERSTDEVDAAEPDDCDPAAINDLIEEMDNRGRESRNAFGQVAEGVRKLRNTFLSVTGKIQDSYHSWAKRLGTTKEGPLWLGFFTEWYDARHLVIRAEITNLLPIICVPIIRAHAQFVEFDEQVDKVSRRLRKAIGELATFPGISDVDLSIRCQLRGMGFWSDLEAFTAVWRDWNRDQGEMEIDTLVEALERLLAHWAPGENPALNLKDTIYIEGQMREGMDLRRIKRDTDLGKLSSEGGSSILRLIILTAAIHLIRDGSNVRFVWCVDEFGRLDRSNSRHLIDMLTANDITLVTGAPDLSAGRRRAFANRLTLQLDPEKKSSSLVAYDKSGTTTVGVRERDEEGNLFYIKDVQK